MEGREGRKEDVRETYEGSDCDACRDGGDGSGADVACDASACCEGAEDETDCVEGSLSKRMREMLSVFVSFFLSFFLPSFLLVFCFILTCFRCFLHGYGSSRVR